MSEQKLKKFKQVSNGISTARSMSNIFKVLLLDAFVALECRYDNECYLYLLHKHFLQNKKPGLCSVSNCESVFRMSDRSKNNLFVSFGHQELLPFFFFHKDEFSNSNIQAFPIPLLDYRVLSSQSFYQKNSKYKPRLNLNVREYSIKNSNVFVFIFKNIILTMAISKHKLFGSLRRKD